MYPRGQGHYVVSKLMEPHHQKHHHLTTDRFFTSPDLFHDLFRNGTLATGTVHNSRKGIPKGLKQLRLPKKEIAARKQGPLLALLWSDRKQIMLFSTTGTTRILRKRNSKNKMQEAPGIVHLYKKYMGGVDLGDKLICVYDPEFRGKKLWRKILFNLIVTATEYKIIKNTFRLPSIAMQETYCRISQREGCPTDKPGLSAFNAKAFCGQNSKSKKKMLYCLFGKSFHMVPRLQSWIVCHRMLSNVSYSDIKVFSRARYYRLFVEIQISSLNNQVNKSRFNIIDKSIN
ncbi:hypothetical protein KUTeg_010633 [Tegillarca granosa]|uniref:PiggyBac transposable element-derived protein domain-containing protein n=1 Tax=Tegillarca granosa TaxID=220873 RepID=A0ABQ9F8A1_TEGGR|nr:hypothetical protein KUTeg_010633 [Tegillarca granosa]